MFASLNRLRERSGAAALEFALCAPIFLALLVGLTEFGRAWTQSLVLQKGVVTGVSYAVRNSLPLNGAALANFENLVKRGSLDSSRPFLLESWSETGATLTVSTSTFNGGGVVKEVVRAQASVPFSPIFPELLNFIGLGDMRIDATYEQAHIGN